MSQTPRGKALTIPDLLRRAARRFESRPALCAEYRKTTSYEDLYLFIQHCRAAWFAAGVKPGQRLATVMPPGPEAVALNLSAMAAGVVLPINPALPHDAVVAQLRLLKPDAVISDPALLPAYQEAAAELQIPYISIQVDTGLPAGQFRLGSTADSAIDAGPPFLPFSKAAVLQTSGSTGEPKRVPLTHGNLLASAANIELAMGLQSDDRFLNVTPHFRVVGIALTLAALKAGNAIYCPPGFLRAQFLDWAAAFQPTWFWAAPSMLKELLPLAQVRGAQPCGPALRMIRTGSASLSAQWLDPLEAAFGVPVVENYGMTEASPQITCNPIDEIAKSARRAGSAGKTAGPEILILGADDAPAEVDALGEIVIRGANVMAAYEDSEAKNQQANEQASFWTGNGSSWFRTGDVGRLDADGYLYLAGRKKEMINRGGEKIWPRNVEDVLLRHPAVEQAVVFPVPHPVLGEEVGAAVVWRGEEDFTDTELRQFAATRLASYQLPTRTIFVDAIPVGDGGKVQRNRLAEQLGLTSQEESSGAAAQYAAPQTTLELELANLWRSILRTPDIGIDDDFFAIGGDSLAVTALLAGLQQRYGVMRRLLDRVDFFDHPTIRAQATLIEHSRLEKAAPIAVETQTETLPKNLIALNQATRRRREPPPLFIAPMAGSDPLYLRHFARHLSGSQRCIGLNLEPIPAGASVEELAYKAAASLLESCPHDPFYLGGHCFGGVVAYEMARQLSAIGRRPEALYLFDVPTPGYPHPVRQFGRFAHAIWKHSTEVNRLKEYATAGLRHLKKLNAARLETVGVPVANDPSVRAMRIYETKPYDGSVVVFIARNHIQTGSPLDRRLGWLEYVRPKPEIVFVDSTHMEFFDNPHAAELAAVCSQRLPKREFETLLVTDAVALEAPPSTRIGVPA